MSRVLPPVIRLFISSTFADMTRERQYFNTVIEPKLSRMCSERGVSFFSVDLRWGITEEDQMSGNVLPICLQEIDNCRPFFIGILGKRYGSILQNVTDATKESFPWLEGHLDKSVTELEMYYGVLRQESKQKETNCLFLFRDDNLSDQYFGETEDAKKIEKLRVLKESIRQDETLNYADYDSLEVFEKEIMEAIENWLNREFPNVASVHEAKKNWYNNELLRDYVSSDKVLAFLDNYGENSTHSLMISGNGLSGKTTVLTDWTPQDGEKILINIGADSDYLYWPYIAHEIIKRLHEIDESVGVPDCKTPATLFFALKASLGKKKEEEGNDDRIEFRFYVTDEDREAFRQGFVSWLRTVKTSVPVYVVINDLNLLSEADAPYLKWLPAETEGSVHIICSANDGTIVDNAQILGWNVKEMVLFPKEDTETLLDRYMGIFGKNLSASQRNNLLNSPLLSFPGYLKYIIRYLNKYGSFDNLDYLCEKIGQIDSTEDLYGFVLDKLLEELNANEKKAVKTALYVLAVTTLGINEDELFGLVGGITPIDPIGWARIHTVFEQFQLVTADAWKIWDGPLIQLVQKFDVPVAEIHSALGHYFNSKMDHEIAFSMSSIKRNTDLSKAVLHHLAKAEAWEILSERLLDWNILYYLSKLEWNCVRAAWVKIFLHSKIDVAKSIFDLLVDFCDKKLEHIDGMKERLAWMLTDMEFLEYAWDAEKKYGISMGSDLRSIDPRQFSKESLDAFERFSNIKQYQQLPMMLQMLTSFLAKNEEHLNPYERTQFYKIKSNAELKLRDLRSGLKTSYKYYEAAIECMNDIELLRALMNRGEIIYFDGGYAEAEKTLLYCQKLAADLGALREFLAINNMMAMISYRRRDFDTALALFDLCANTWEKLGDKREVITIWLNKCNCLVLMDDVAGAVKMAEELKSYIEHLPGREYQMQYTQVLSNLGQFYDKLGEAEKAEAYFLQQLQEAEKIKFVRDKDFQVIIAFYEKQQQLTKAIDMMKRLLEHLFEQKQYDQMEYWINKCIDTMDVTGYRHQIESFRNMWRERIAKAIGEDSSYSGENRNKFDPLAETRLKEALSVARSDRDEMKVGEILFDLAVLVYAKDKQEASDLFVQSMNSFGKVGQTGKSIKAACQATRVLVELGEKEDYENGVLPFIKDQEKLKSDGLDAGALTMIDEWFALHDETIADEIFALKVNHILSLLQDSSSQSMALFGTYCFTDEAEKLFDKLPEDTLLAVIAWMKEQDKDMFEEFAGKVFRSISAPIADDHKELLNVFVGPRADELLTLFEKRIHVAVALETVDAGAIAGNIALIYRRRGDKEKTYALHELAIKIYEKHGLLRDMYIEKMNLCTAYQELESTDKCIDGLRAILREPEIENIKDMQAAIAGNLAAFLKRLGNEADDQEIVACFKIEESYYEKAGEVRELAISLLNQVQFYLAKSILSPKEILEMFNRAEQIVRKYHIREFESAIARLKVVVMAAQEKNSVYAQGEEKKENKDQKQSSKVDLINRARAKLLGAKQEQPSEKDEIKQNQEEREYTVGDVINRLLEENEYEIMNVVEARGDDYMEVVCKKKNQVPLVVDNLKLSIELSKPICIKYQFLMLPNPSARPITEELRKYAAWWNRLNEYQLHLVQDTEGRDVLMVQEAYQAATVDDIIATFGRVAKLWNADLMSVSITTLTGMPMDSLMAAKMQLLSE